MSHFRETRLKSLMEMTELMRDMPEDKRNEFLRILRKLIASGSKNMARQIGENTAAQAKRLRVKNAKLLKQMSKARASKHSGKAEEREEGQLPENQKNAPDPKK